MQGPIQRITGSVTAPRGFRASGVHCGVKTRGTGKGSDKGPLKKDVALVVSDRPASIAGTFTSNQVAAAPVRVSVQRARRDTARAVVLNSGNANACTGAQGMADAIAMTEQVARGLGFTADETLVCSTGRIGLPMPMEALARGIEDAMANLADSLDAATDAALAIMTSDTHEKECAVEVTAPEGRVARIGGIAKGAGMIEPQMRSTLDMPRDGLHATMLSVITTDFAVNPDTLKEALRASVQRSFNRITVDGDMSTNDTVLVLANGASETEEVVDLRSDWGQVFQEALDTVCLALAKMIVADGEGITKVVTLRVEGARSDEEADAVARAVGNSALVKTSWCGGDPNWGRIMDAIGYARARIDESRIDIGYCAQGAKEPVWATRGGVDSGIAFEDQKAITLASEFEIWIRLGLGDGAATLYAADLTEGYVEFNLGE